MTCVLAACDTIVPRSSEPSGVLQKKKREPWLRTFLSGFALTMGNPKTIVFYLALLPTLVPLDKMTILGFFELVGIVVVLLLLIGFAYAWLAGRAREFFKSPRALRRLNRFTGGVLAVAAGAVIVRS